MISRGHWEYRGPEGRRLSDDAVGRPRGATKLLRIFLEKLMDVNEEKKDGRGNFLLTLGSIF